MEAVAKKMNKMQEILQLEGEKRRKSLKYEQFCTMCKKLCKTSAFQKKNLAFLRQIYYNDCASTVPQQIKC